MYINAYIVLSGDGKVALVFKEIQGNVKIPSVEASSLDLAMAMAMLHLFRLFNDFEVTFYADKTAVSHLEYKTTGAMPGD